ncbi:MAG: hypothetical protein C0601_11340 [Candidatus Muiribacterium halophilum]|uniref:Uncharacterized protein n=1 Tax=Muiribacterium halophilum TaxID=2053465 RepID=A0A2N5ZC27_MUIH1|nr:MAG: hypothetical protein C0601_11340 [Candidatus Muirbacterium halophilum]
MRKNIIITSLILLFSIIIFGNKTNDVRIKKYNPILKYSLVSPWFEYIPSNSKIGVISTALDQLGIKKFVFKTLYNLHTKNINLDYNYVNQINRSHKQYINIWQNENKEHILNTTYYPKYTGFELLNSISVGWNNYFTTGINYLKTDKSEGVLNLYKGERYNLILRLSNTEYEYSSDYPVIIKDIDVQSLTFIKDLKDDGI